MAMERCPPEIWHYILSPICNDGGTTALRLSSVSKFIRNISAPVRFQSATCKTSRSIISLTYALESTPPHQRIMRHLFISSTRWQPPPTSSSVSRPTQSVKIRSSTARDGSIHYAILHILTLVAPTLQTFSMVAHCSTWVQLPFPPSLPALQELSIQHEFPGGCLVSSALDSLKEAPALKMLILFGFLRVSQPIEIAGTIRSIAPGLTHLLLPHDAGNGGRLLRSFAREVCLNALGHGSRVDEEGKVELPTALEALYLGTGASAPPFLMVQNGKRIVPSNNRFNRSLDKLGEMHIHWLARLEGRNGYWKDDWADVPVEELSLSRLQLGQ
ncbi:hypothetical protein HWV62_34671 [Athelia sp. TMB]|nr:hypothetical protein HWV62_34671 [Athelia sp. TMB]